MLSAIHTILALFSLIAATVTTGAMYSAGTTTQATFAQVYYDYLAVTPSTKYLQGKTVTFSLHSNTHTPLLSPLVWKIADSTGRVVYQSSPSSNSSSSFTYNGSWNQKNQDGQDVPPGVYTLIFPQTPNKAAVVFMILPGKNDSFNDEMEYVETNLPLNTI